MSIMREVALEPLQLLAIAILLLGTALVTPATAGSGYTLSGETVTVDPGGTTSVAVLLDNEAGIDAFQFGLAYEPTELTLDTIVQGAAVSGLHGGAGPDFYFSEIDPDGAAGAIVGAIFSLAPPFVEISAGTGHVLAHLGFTAAFGIPTSTDSPLTFTEELGDPPVQVVVAVGAQAITPVQVAGEVTFNPAPPTDLVCTPVGCSLDYDLTWTNPTTYGSLQIFVDGIQVDSAIGGTSSGSVTLAPGPHEIGVRGTFGALQSQLTVCTVVADPLPDPVLDLQCTVNPDSCLGTVSWTNGESYDSIEIRHDGLLIETLPGTATSTTLLTSDTVIEVCVTPINVCGTGPATSCGAACGVSFIRGDCNLDTGLDIADAIAGLGILFGGSAPNGCEDACDANDDGGFDIADMIYVLNVLFVSGDPPPAPFPACGPDVTTDTLDCTVGC
ncbi:MAG: hypothetical protein AAF488_05940 [Planctomycetota bacterium]